MIGQFLFDLSKFCRYDEASTNSVDTLFHVLAFVPAKAANATIMAITIREIIKPYSTAVAPSSQCVTFLINFSIPRLTLSIRLRTIVFFHKGVNKFFHMPKEMENNPTMLFVVAVALINQSDEILLQKRPEGRTMAGLWEFPGGKVESGESPESALIREVEEELAIDISGANLVPLTFASEPLGERHLMLLLYICRNWDGEPVSQEGAELKWTTPAMMRKLPMPPADLPFVDHLEKYLDQ